MLRMPLGAAIAMYAMRLTGTTLATVFRLAVATPLTVLVATQTASVHRAVGVGCLAQTILATRR